MDKRSYDNAPDSIEVRELQAGGKTLVTTMPCAKSTSRNALKDLYKERWNIELDFRNLKTTMGMDMLSCRTPEMIIKEIWVYFLGYNLIRLLMTQSAMVHGLLPRKISFKHTVQLWLAWQTCNGCTDATTQLFALIAQRRVGNRPDRVEPRAMKRRPKVFPWLFIPRAQAQAHIRTHGHP